MTQEEKAKAYDKAINRAINHRNHDGLTLEQYDTIEVIFPELAESEDEKTRKELIQFIKNWKDPNNIGRPHDFPTLTRNVEQCDRYIAWLEKQKEFVSADFDDVWDTADCDELTAPLEKYSKDAIKEMCHAWYDKGIELERKSWLEKQGVQKQDPCEHCKDKCLNCYNFPCITKREFERDKSGMEVIKEEKVDNADKAKPKFKIGDWVACEELNTALIINIDDDRYEVEFIDGNKGFPHTNYIDRLFHLWTIKDVKDGDVLQLGGVTAIFQKYIGNGNCRCYCSVYNGEFEIPSQDGADNSYGCVDAIPATKEQRDTLFAKMEEADYKWDKEKKELKKVAQKPADKVEPKFHDGDWVVISTTKGDRVVQIASVQYFTKDGYPSYITTEGRWFGKGTKARLLTDKDVKITTIPESKAIVNKIKSWSEEDERICQCLIRDQEKALDEVSNDKYGHSEIISDLKEMYRERIDWLKSLKQRIGE